MRTTDRLWGPITLGRIPLDNRLAMAPMTRYRSTPEGIPTESNAEHSTQRAFYTVNEQGYTHYAVLSETIPAGNHAA